MNDQNWLDKFQCLCHWCNYEKGENCKVCTIESCLGCELYDPLAYSGLMLKLTPELVERLTSLANKSGIPLKKLVNDIIESSVADAEKKS